MAQILTQGVVVGDTWTVEEQLGRGGMGEVWRVRHLRVEGKQAAIKVLHSMSANADFVTRFRREAEIAARLEHPNIVQVFDFDALPSGEPYIVMEYLRGESLKQRLARGPLPLEELQPLVLQLCSALHVAHAAGVVHRDLKPDNLLLVPTPTGPQLKVLDFGISKLVDSNTLQTSDSVLIGTPRYMSPEQAMGENAALTSRSDIFSLASICYEALSGEAPFRGDGVAKIVHRIIYDEPPDIPGLDEAVMKGLRRALSKDPGHRTPDVAAFASDFTGSSLSGVIAKPEVEGVTRETARPAALVARPAGAPQTISTRGARPRASVPDAAGSSLARPRARVLMAVIALFVAVGAGVWAGMMQQKAEGEPTAPRSPQPIQLTDAGLAADAGVLAVEAVDAVHASPAAPVVSLSLADAGSRRRAVGGAVPTPEPPLDDAQQGLLQDAEQALARSEYGEVLALTVKPALSSSGRAAALRMMAACGVGNLGLANSTRPRVPPAQLPAARKFCRDRGAEVP